MRQRVEESAPPSGPGLAAPPRSAISFHAEQAPHGGYLPLGSWRLNVQASERRYLETLGSLFRQRIEGTPLRSCGQIDAELYLLSREYDAPDFGAGRRGLGGKVASWAKAADGGRELFTGKFRVVLEPHAVPRRIFILVVEPQYSPREFRDGLFLVLSKLLFELDCFYIHAAAVELKGKVNVFVGQGSFGKTTTCLRLGQAGATILSEDHVLFKRTANGFVLSGCQDTARVTPKTERYIFGERLAELPPQADGKREFRLEQYFSAAPYRDFPFHRILFNHVGEQLSLRAISQQEAVVRLFGMTRTFRAGRPADLGAYLQYFASLVEGCALYDLELSPDLSRLDALVELLRA